MMHTFNFAKMDSKNQSKTSSPELKMPTFNQNKTPNPSSRPKKSEWKVTADNPSTLRNLTSMDSSNTGLLNSLQLQPKTQVLSRIPELGERMRESYGKESKENPVKKSRLSLSQMGNKKSQSGSKSNSGMSNFGSLTIKMSSREEELPTSSSKNPKMENSEESIQNMKQRLINAQKYIQEENEKSQNSMINCSDYNESDDSQDNPEASRLSSKQPLQPNELAPFDPNNIACNPVIEIEDEKESEDQLGKRDSQILDIESGEIEVEEKRDAQILNIESGEIEDEQNLEEEVQEEHQPMQTKETNEGAESGIAMTRSRSGRIRRKPQGNDYFLNFGPNKDQSYIVKRKKTKIKSCNCTKSNCLSSYCICFKKNLFCSTRCNCVCCINIPENTTLVTQIKRVLNDMNSLPSEQQFPKIPINLKGKNNSTIARSKKPKKTNQQM